MNKTFKKIISLVLSLIMLMSFAVVSFATDGEAATGEYNSILQILVEFANSFWDLIKYVFYEVFLGVAP